MREHLPFIVAISVCATLNLAQHLPRPQREDRRRLLESAVERGSLEAVRRLVALEKGAVMPVPRACLGLDHPFVRVAEQGPDRVVIEATISDKPEKENSDEGGRYWSLTLLEFDGAGRLIRWEPFRP